VCRYLSTPDKYRKLGANERIKGFLAKMNPDPNVVCILDAEALFESLPLFMNAALEKQGRGARSQFELAVDREKSKGILIGWTGKVQKNGFSGEAIVEADMIPALVSSARRVAIELQRSVSTVRPPNPRQAPETP
jgi:hypothetical protein